MDHTRILLSDDTSDEEKNQSANQIINTGDLPLSVEQILLAHARIYAFVSTNNTRKNNRIFLLNKILSINTNMYVAIIIALCDKFDPACLSSLMALQPCTDHCIGVYTRFQCAVVLLNYHEFNINNMPNTSDINKKLFEEYRHVKYSGKFTKDVNKNDN